MPRPPVSVAPFLLATMPLPEPATDAELPARLAQLPYGLPTSDELEWALRAPSETLFYFGNHFDPPGEEEWPPFLQLGPSKQPSWPEYSQLGLWGAVAVSQWCTFRAGEHEVLAVRGGAGHYFPWQDSGEWLWMLSGLTVPAALIDGEAAVHGIRPVLRLG